MRSPHKSAEGDLNVAIGFRRMEDREAVDIAP